MAYLRHSVNLMLKGCEHLMRHRSPVAAICHKSLGSRPEATSLTPSILLSSLSLVDSPGVCSPAAKHFDTIYTVKQPYKIHIDV